MEQRLRLHSITEPYPSLKKALSESKDEREFCALLREDVDRYFKDNDLVNSYYRGEKAGREIFSKLTWRDYGAIRFADLLDSEGRRFPDPNNHNQMVCSYPFTLFWRSMRQNHEIAGDLLAELESLFDQFYGDSTPEIPTKETLLKWMDKHPSGLDEDIVKVRELNTERILKVIEKKLDARGGRKGAYSFPANASSKEKQILLHKWWRESRFHLTFAIRDTDTLCEMLGCSEDDASLQIMREAEAKGIPIFINPYYISLLDSDSKLKRDLPIRTYIFYSHSLLEAFGDISAWEKEDEVVPGEPNAAGWLLPSTNIHRRYPEVAIFIPETMGRACAGLCSSCQRMYGFQSGDLNFDLDDLKPQKSWPERMRELLYYYRQDSQLRDVLITGGDALMSSDESLEEIFNELLKMIEGKIEDNRNRSEKYAEIRRIRLGTRLLAYLPYRITPNLKRILTDFRTKAAALGVEQCVIQTHFESSLEITPAVRGAVSMILSSGWYITNQMVFTTAGSLRGHTAKLRSTLNDIGILPYYTFSVKGFKENRANFATNARAQQEMLEEKVFGVCSDTNFRDLHEALKTPSKLVETLKDIREKSNLPFISTDRNVINLPGLGKSQTFRTIGLTADGRRILQFDLDHGRSHSPITEGMDPIVIIESKSIAQYLREVSSFGDDLWEYRSVYGYSIGETEYLARMYKYPSYNYPLTSEVTNFRG